MHSNKKMLQTNRSSVICFEAAAVFELWCFQPEHISRENKGNDKIASHVYLQYLWSPLGENRLWSNESFESRKEKKKAPRLTIVAQGPGIRCHAAVTGEALPLLQANPLVWARVLLTGGAGTCSDRRGGFGRRQKKKNNEKKKVRRKEKAGALLWLCLEPSVFATVCQYSVFIFRPHFLGTFCILEMAGQTIALQWCYD